MLSCRIDEASQWFSMLILSKGVAVVSPKLQVDRWIRTRTVADVVEDDSKALIIWSR